MKKILIVCNVDWFLVSHRLEIIKKLIDSGYQVHIACEDTGKGKDLSSLGANFIDFRFSRSGMNPLKEMQTLLRFFKLYRNISPNLVHHVTIKPVIYGSLIAKIIKIPAVVNAIAGLGLNFSVENSNLFFKFLVRVMRIGFNRPNVGVIFQNETDYNDLLDSKVLNSQNKIYYTKGSGVNLELYKPNNKENKDKIYVLLPARMLWEKGIGEYIQAAVELKEKFSDKVCFLLAGRADDDSKNGVSSEYLNSIRIDGYLEWIGFQSNMIEVLSNVDIVVLPSYYREGIPKSLIEACAFGKPIITTNSVGCKECVDDGKNGYLIEPKSVPELVSALTKMLESKTLRESFGIEARRKAEEEFSVDTVVSIHLDIYKDLLN